MKERDARRIILALLGSALISTWWVAFSLPPPGHPILDEPSSSIRTHLNATLKASTSKRDSARKPFFVLHVGPPKTATTSIQCGLEALSADLAKEDSYYFVGKRCPGSKNKTMDNGESSIPGHHLMMGLISANPNSRGFEKLKERLDHHYSLGNNMIYSLEAMSNHLEDRPETWALFLSLFEGWEVRIVVAYRHYFDWIRSMYFQQHIGKKYKRLWPHQRGLAIPSFRQFLANHLHRWSEGNPSNDADSWGQHLTLYTIQYFLKHFEDVRVFDLHQEGDVLTNFVCQMMPGADTVCHRLRNEAFVEAIVKRESHSFDADHLALAAYEGGMLDKDVFRGDAIKSIEQHLQTTNDLSNPNNMACLSKELSAMFLNASLWFEREVAASIPGGGDLRAVFKRDNSDHKALFNRASDSGKFCEINSKNVLELEHWRKLIADIGAKKKK